MPMASNHDPSCVYIAILLGSDNFETSRDPAAPRADRNFDGVPRTDLTPRPHHYGPVLNGAADVPVTAHAQLTRRAGNRASSKSTLGTNTVSVDFDCVARPGTRAYTHELLRMPFSLLPFSRRVGSRKSQRRTLT